MDLCICLLKLNYISVIYRYIRQHTKYVMLSGLCLAGYLGKSLDVKAVFLKVYLLLYPAVVLRWGTEALACQIQKLADRSDVISEVTKMHQNPYFLGLTSGHRWGAYSAPPDSLTDGEGACCPLHSRPFGSRFCWSQGLTHYRVGNPTNDRLQM